ncbi:ethyl tert-butyl ether degradation EthD [Komagataeibacter diospyri]|nr:ethyl tert-butyl ether degradation EthD [Komagataeibacter diospyri]
MCGIFLAGMAPPEVAAHQIDDFLGKIMTTMYVTYPGKSDAWFDRDYYVTHHMPLVMEAWSSIGLKSATAFFPTDTTNGTVAICECQFKDESALQAALASPETPRVLADLKNFTKIEPVLQRGINI